jgi:hypothetical protein
MERLTFSLDKLKIRYGLWKNFFYFDLIIYFIIIGYYKIWKINSIYKV